MIFINIQAMRIKKNGKVLIQDYVLSNIFHKKNKYFDSY